MLYLLMLTFFIGRNSFILILVYLERLSWVFTILMSPFLAIKYLIMQAYFIVLSLVGLLWAPLLLVVGLLLKVGLPPVHVWFMKLSFFMKKWVFLIFSTLHKLLPLFLLGRLFLLGNYLLGTLLLLAGRLIFQIFELFFILVTSSIVHRRWTLLRIQYRLKLSLTYWILYSLVFFTFLSTIHFIILFKRGVEQSSSTSAMWLILSGLPPFVIFWLKVWIFFFIVQIRVGLRLVLIFISVVALTSYFRAFHIGLRLTFFSSVLKMLVIRIFFLSFI
jgi:hypothetical protein